MSRNYILDERTVALKLERIAYEIHENNLDEAAIIFVGIRENGSVIARNMQKLFGSISKVPTSLIHLELDKSR